MRVTKRACGWANKEKGLMSTATAVILGKEVPHNLLYQTRNRMSFVTQTPSKSFFLWLSTLT